MTDLKLFESRNVRSAWDAEEEKWYFSIVDVVGVLTDSPNPRNYWKVLKHRLIKEGNELVTNCNQLKLKSPDGNSSFTRKVEFCQLPFNLIYLVRAVKWIYLTYYQNLQKMYYLQLKIVR